MPSYPDPTESNPTTGPTYTNRLKDGCYLIRYIPTEPSPDVHFYEGTLRVLHLGPNGELNAHGEIKASGDLYSRLKAFPHGRAPEEWLSRARTTDAATIT